MIYIMIIQQFIRDLESLPSKAYLDWFVASQKGFKLVKVPH